MDLRTGYFLYELLYYIHTSVTGKGGIWQDHISYFRLMYRVAPFHAVSMLKMRMGVK
jgi:hypothetical protein